MTGSVAALSAMIGQLRDVRDAVNEVMGESRAVVPTQWLQFASIVHDYAPDLIIELGRAYGNSTCAMAVAADRLPGRPCRILSVCLTDVFNTETLPHLRRQLADSSFCDLVTAVKGDITRFDFAPHIADARRILLFWDAHGFEVADFILSRLMPALSEREHLVLVHDMADLGYMPEALRAYGTEAEWARYGSAAPRFILGDVGTQFEEGIALVDFLGRNRVAFRSGESSYFSALDDAQRAELSGIFGEDFSPFAFWYSFSLNEAPGPLTFPPAPAASPYIMAAHHWDALKTAGHVDPEPAPPVFEASFQAENASRIAEGPAGEIEVAFAGQQWANVASALRREGGDGLDRPAVVSVSLVVHDGAVGVGCLHQDWRRYVGRELIVEAGPALQVVLIPVESLAEVRSLTLRNGRPGGGSGRVSIHAVETRGLIRPWA